MRDMTKKILLSVIVLAATVGSLQAGLLEYTPYGVPAVTYNAAGMALNLKGVALSGQGLLANPALIAEGDGLAAQFSTGIDWRREYRSVEVFDSYANSVGLFTKTINDQTDYNIHSAEASYSTSLWKIPKISVGFGISREYDFNYRLKYEERDAFYYLTEIYQQEMKGAVYGYSGALAVKPFSFLSMGLGLTRLAGKPSLTITDDFTDPTYTDQKISYQFDYKGNRFFAGLLGSISPRVKVGLTWKSSARLTGQMTYSELENESFLLDQRVGLPSSYAVGITYQPTNEFPAVVNLEYEHSPWQNLEDNLFGYRLAEVNRYGFGVTHRMRSGMPIRFGVSFANSYRSSSIGLARAGFGTEINVSRVVTGISAGVGRRTYNYGQAFGTSSSTNVSETMADLMLTFSVK